MMWIIQSAIGNVFEILFFPFQRSSPWFAMGVISFMTGILMLVIFRLTSNQEGIRAIKNRIKAHLLELRLYKDNMAVSLKAQGKILRSNLKYVSYSMKPLLVMIVPVILILIHLNLWYGFKPLALGEPSILKVKLENKGDLLQSEFHLSGGPGLVVDTPPLRIEEEGEIDWRFHAREKGTHLLIVRSKGYEHTKEVVAGLNGLIKISPVKQKNHFWPQLLSPGEKPIPKDSPVKSIEVIYPSKNMNFLGWNIHWLVVFFVLSIILGFAFKGLFKVEI